MGPLWKDFFQFLILTGTRRNEPWGLKKKEVDFQRRLWTVPPERYKTGDSHTIPLADAAFAIVKQRSDLSQDGRLFPLTTFAKHVGWLQAKVIELLGPTPEQWTLQDCRRTFRTRLSAMGVPAEVAEMCIGHKPKGIQAVYNQHSFIPQMAQAFRKWEAFLERLTTRKQSAKVVNMR
jgi:integrase